MAKVIDTRGMRCPIPILKARKALNQLESDIYVEILASDHQTPRDFTVFCDENGYILKVNETVEDGYRFVIYKP